jgi:Zn-dependent peptidase ImmA (M78 family)/DNA-binding XRE family transcriptional regulator
MPNNELASRLKGARESLGLTLVEAARRLGFQNYQTLMSIENSEREVKASELSTFSKVYFVSISNLLGEKNLQPLNAFLWRNPPSRDESKKQIEAAIFYRCEQYSLLERLLNLKVRKSTLLDVKIEDIGSPNNITKLSEKFRDYLGLGSRPAFTLQKVLEQDFGVKILFEKMPEGSAVSTSNPEFGSVIVINSEETPWRRNYDLAHELFHLITWNAVSLKDLADPAYFSDIEKKAERFASILLLPANEVKADVVERVETQKQFTYSDLVDIAMEFGVSAKALLYRMANLRMLEWEDADRIARDQELTEISRNKRQEERGERPKSERFISLAVRCLRKGLISRGKFAEMVGVDRSDIDDFIEETGLMELEGNPIEIMAS